MNIKEHLHLVLQEGLLYKNSEEHKNNTKTAAFLQKKFGGKYDYYEIIDKMSFHNQIVDKLEDVYGGNSYDDDGFDDEYNEEGGHPQWSERYEEMMDEMTNPYRTTYELKFEYSGGRFVISWIKPVGHPGGNTFSNLLKKLSRMLQYFNVKDYTIKDITTDSKRPHVSYTHINGDEYHREYKRAEKERLPYNPDNIVDMNSYMGTVKENMKLAPLFGGLLKNELPRNHTL